jgi:hypothetical protein
MALGLRLLALHRDKRKIPPYIESQGKTLQSIQERRAAAARLSHLSSGGKHAAQRCRHGSTAQELERAYTPSQEELTWARGRVRTPNHLLCLGILLKSFQRLHYFPDLNAVPEVVDDSNSARTEGRRKGCHARRPQFSQPALDKLRQALRRLCPGPRQAAGAVVRWPASAQKTAAGTPESAIIEFYARHIAGWKRAETVFLVSHAYGGIVCLSRCRAHMVEAIPLREEFSRDKGWSDDHVFGLINLLPS